MRFDLKITGARELLGKLNDEAGKDAMTKFLDRSAIYLQSQARSNIQEKKAIDTGSLLNSIGIEPESELSRLVGTGLTYAPTVEFGRSAFSKLPPPGALLGWMGRHRFAASEETPLRFAIAMRGIAPRPFMQPAVDATEQYMESILPDAAMQIEQEMTT